MRAKGLTPKSIKGLINTLFPPAGRQVLKALENSVSQYPALEGRFPQVAGIRFAFDPLKPAGSRVDPRYVCIQERYLDLDKVGVNDD